MTPKIVHHELHYDAKTVTEFSQTLQKDDLISLTIQSYLRVKYVIEVLPTLGYNRICAVRIDGESGKEIKNISALAVVLGSWCPKLEILDLRFKTGGEMSRFLGAFLACSPPLHTLIFKRIVALDAQIYAAMQGSEITSLAILPGVFHDEGLNSFLYTGKITNLSITGRSTGPQRVGPSTCTDLTTCITSHLDKMKNLKTLTLTDVSVDYECITPSIETLTLTNVNFWLTCDTSRVTSLTLNACNMDAEQDLSNVRKLIYSDGASYGVFGVHGASPAVLETVLRTCKVITYMKITANWRQPLDIHSLTTLVKLVVSGVRCEKLAAPVAQLLNTPGNRLKKVNFATQFNPDHVLFPLLKDGARTLESLIINGKAVIYREASVLDNEYSEKGLPGAMVGIIQMFVGKSGY